MFRSSEYCSFFGKVRVVVRYIRWLWVRCRVMVLFFVVRGCVLQPGESLFVYLVGFGFNKIVVVKKNVIFL